MTDNKNPSPFQWLEAEHNQPQKPEVFTALGHCARCGSSLAPVRCYSHWQCASCGAVLESCCGD